VLKVTENLQPIESEFYDEAGNCYLVRIRPYRIESNAVDGILITFVNINVFKSEQHKVELLTQRLNDSLNVGKMAWWEWDLKAGLVTFDPKKATMLGYTVEEFPTDVYKICDLIHPEDYEHTMEVMRKHLQGITSAWVTTYRIRRKSGEYSWYYDRGEITERDAQGKPLKLVGTVVDVSEIKLLEQNFKLQNEKLRQAIDKEAISDE